MDYKNYLKSKHWISVKEKYKNSKLNKNCCYCCNSKKNLQLHHKTYKRLYKEKLTDLIYLCDKCHTQVHLLLIKSNSQKVNLWNCSKKYKKKINNLKKKKHKNKIKKV